jgi:DNA end-binding protein Ku
VEEEAEPEPTQTEAVPAPQPQVVERADMVKGYEFEKGRFVLFSAAELQALQAGARQTIDIVSFIPERSVDPIYYDKAYYLAPDQRGAKTYSLLLAAMRESRRCALAKWAWRSKEYVVEIRPGDAGLVLQQLLYADEVRSLADLGIELLPVGQAELKLALQLIAQISQDSYDPHAFVDEEKQRILAAVERKIAGRQVVAPSPSPQVSSGEVVDLIAALQARLQSRCRPHHAQARPAGNERREDRQGGPGRRGVLYALACAPMTAAGSSLSSVTGQNRQRLACARRGRQLLLHATRIVRRVRVRNGDRERRGGDPIAGVARRGR